MKIRKRGFSFTKDKARIFTDENPDAYRIREKYPEPTQCPECGVVYSEGRWQWGRSTDVINEVTCPACKRTEAHDPAGVVELTGNFFTGHRNEILNMIQNLERLESNERPLERILDIHRFEDRTVIHTTGMHLPQRIGHAIESAFEGDLNLNYDAKDLVEVKWHRD